MLDNRQVDADVDVTQFPAPFWHAEDGGNFLGTGQHRHHARPGHRLW